MTRYALRQGGSDVITKTALKRINWGNYKINQSSDKVGVFVSIVSTKIPYKGAGKEYIGAQWLHGCAHSASCVCIAEQSCCKWRLCMCQSGLHAAHVYLGA